MPTYPCTIQLPGKPRLGIRFTRYSNMYKNIAVMMYVDDPRSESDGKLWSDLTVNLPSSPLTGNSGWVPKHKLEYAKAIAAQGFCKITSRTTEYGNFGQGATLVEFMPDKAAKATRQPSGMPIDKALFQLVMNPEVYAEIDSLASGHADTEYIVFDTKDAIENFMFENEDEHPELVRALRGIGDVNAITEAAYREYIRILDSPDAPDPELRKRRKARREMESNPEYQHLWPLAYALTDYQICTPGDFGETYADPREFVPARDHDVSETWDFEVRARFEWIVDAIRADDIDRLYVLLYSDDEDGERIKAMIDELKKPAKVNTKAKSTAKPKSDGKQATPRKRDARGRFVKSSSRKSKTPAKKKPAAKSGARRRP